MASLDGGATRTRYRLAYAAMVWEAVWPALWPALGIAGVFLVLALLDWLPALNAWVHGALLLSFAGAFGAALWLGLKDLRLPDRAAARRRLEQASNLEHRPLTALQDKPVADDPASRALWAAHQERMARATRDLKVGAPVAGLGRRDPIGLRAALLLVLLVVGVGAALDYRERLVRAVLPGFTVTAPIPVVADVWITPPAYTGLPPIFASSLPQDQTIAVPTGSMLLAQVAGLRAAPTLQVGSAAQALTEVEPGTFRAEVTVTAGDRLTLTQAQARAPLASWPMTVIPDTPPVIGFKQPPSASNRFALRLDYTAKDDYGLDGGVARIRRTDKPELPAIELPLTIVGQRKESSGTGYHDLTPHPWAGLPVTIELSATDAIGQTGRSDPVEMTLPERKFQHPVARAIVEQRKILILDHAKAREVGQALGRIAAMPSLYYEDTVVFLGLTMSRNRLFLEQAETVVEPVQRLLWDLAIRVEEGDLGLRERDLRAAEQALRDALARNAPDAELQKLIDELQQALDRFLDQMIQQALQNPGRARPIPRDRNMQTVERRDLQRMLDQARQLARQGQRDAAQQLLNQLRQMLENMQAGVMEGDDQDGEGNDEMNQAMQGLQDLSRRQRDLMDRSMRQSNRGQRGQQGQRGQRGQQGQQQGQQGDGEGEDAEAMAGEQEALRRELGEIMRKLGESMGDMPGSLGRAERSMRDARGALGRGQPGQAVGPQGDALDQLRQAQQALADQMQQQAGQGQGEGRGTARPEGQRQANPTRDPFGRPMPGATGVDTGDITIPDEGQAQRAREIFDELRRRAADPSRPTIEREYIDRLLKRF